MSEVHVVFAGHDACRIGRIRDGQVTLCPLPVDGAPAEAVEAVKRELALAGYNGHAVVLALPSQWCLSATVSCKGVERSGRQRSLAFRLEEHLPVSAEDIAAAYVQYNDDEALGVCCETAKLKEVVAALEAAGVRIRHVCPTALMAAATVVQQLPQANAVLLVDDRGDAKQFDWIEMQDGLPCSWRWFADDVAATRDQLDAWLADAGESAQLAVVGDSAALVGQKTGADGRIVWVPGSRDEAAVRHAARVLKHAVIPWLDLRCDGLAAGDGYSVHRGPLRALTVAIAVLLICCCLVALWRAGRYESLAAGFRQQQVDVFNKAMPNQRVPGSILGRLLSERQRLAALNGQGIRGVNAAALHTTSALEHLRNVLAALPADLRFRILDLSIRPDSISVDGQARSHVEAEAIAVSLRQAGAYEVDSPRTQSLEQGVSFIFTARPARRQ